MSANYNNSAWFYDRLSRLVYGKALVEAQVFLLQFIPQHSRILIAGGGTGWILDEITKLHPSGLAITYIEVAPKMMELSQKRSTGDNEVVFITEPVENVSLKTGFDAVITPFLFDNFKEETLQKVFGHLHSAIKPGGLWLNADFQLSGKWWQHVLLNSMFLFFRVICNIEASRLPEIEKQFGEHNYEAIEQKTFFGGFIVSSLYTKSHGRDASRVCN
jgi:ubiquinone/menaquinone biosynthesis C-methylase UbiE